MVWTTTCTSSTCARGSLAEQPAGTDRRFLLPSPFFLTGLRLGQPLFFVQHVAIALKKMGRNMSLLSNHTLPVEDLLPDLVALRRDLHAHPELAYEEHRTARIASQALRLLGLEVCEGVGGTGVVGTLRCGDPGVARRDGSRPRSVGLRADLDALPLVELGQRPYASRHPGKHHGCGHDGHTAMLIGAARQLVRTHQRLGLHGTVHFIFQPAEEGQAGAARMIEEGLFDRFPCDSVYALHNWPDLPLGHAQTRPGPIMAAADRFDITVRGKGGHAAQPHHTPDALLAASQLVVQLNTIVSRRIDPSEAAVLSVTRIEGGHSHNVLPAEVRITGTVRSFALDVQDRIETALRASVEGMALGTGTVMEVDYRRYYPATINSSAEAALALDAAVAAGLQAEIVSWSNEIGHLDRGP